MKRASGLAMQALLLLALSLRGAHADTNVALNSLTDLYGADFGNGGAWGGGPAADASTLTDGVFLEENHQWNLDTIFWSGQRGADLLRVFLPSVARVTRLVLQADNNDSYLVRYRGANNDWHDLASMYGSGAWGMSTTTVTLAAPVYATAFAILGDGGDRYYAVSEFQAFGTFGTEQPPVPSRPVPEPAGWAMLASGIFLLSRLRAR